MMNAYLFCFKLVIFCLAADKALAACGGTSKPFVPLGDKFVLANPERGYYHYHEITFKNYKPLDTNDLKTWAKENVTLVFMIFNIEPYVTKSLAPVLDKMTADFGKLRSAGMKSIVRFSYNQTEAKKPSEITHTTDAKLPQLLNHIKELAPILRSSSDVIAVVQVGFIGTWGEWYYSKNYATPQDGGKWFAPTDAQRKDRRTIVEALVKAVPSNLMVQLRYPTEKQKICGDVNLNPSQAFVSSNMCSRIGIHNDCFLATGRDRGTFDEGKESAQRLWLEKEGLYTMVGGESCEKNSKTGCTEAKSQIRKQRFSYLNLDYEKEVIKQWVDGGCYKFNGNRMGYRFELIDGVVPTTAKKGGNYCVSLNINNTGVAPLYNDRPVELILREKSTQKLNIFSQKVSPRTFSPDKVTKVDFTASLPSNIPTGKYDVIVNLPDASSSLRNNPQYRILFSNGGGVQEPKTRFNIVGQVTIQ